MGELFESVFGGVGITGIIVEVELRLRESTKWDVTTEKGKFPYKCHNYNIESIAEKLMLVSNTSDTMLYFETAEGRYEIRYVKPAVTCPRSADKAVPTDTLEEESSCVDQASCNWCYDAAVRCVETACAL